MTSDGESEQVPQDPDEQIAAALDAATENMTLDKKTMTLFVVMALVEAIVRFWTFPVRWVYGKLR